MGRIAVSEARRRLFQLVGEAAEWHVPASIAGRRNTAALVEESDWRVVEEALFLFSIPGVRESILDGTATPIEDCSENAGW